VRIELAVDVPQAVSAGQSYLKLCCLTEYPLVPELAMVHHTTHPSKEQVRAYMAEREAARRPPPAPAEIRRRLGWRLDGPDQDRVLLQFYLMPSTCGHLAAQLALDWYFTSVRPRTSPRSKP
jgi:hypothetical protein